MKNKGMIAALGLILVLGIVTTAATRRYIREQAGSERSLTVGPEAMYEAEPLAAEAAENGLAEDAPEPSSKKMAHVESVGTEDRACMQAEGDVSVQSLGEQKEKRADNRAAAKAAEKQSAGDESDHSVNTGAVVSPVENGIVSPGGVGFDINCGVRLIKTNLKQADIEDKIDELIEALFKNIPSGVGSKGKIKLKENEIDDVLNFGAEWAVENGYGWKEDLEVLEENGRIKERM